VKKLLNKIIKILKYPYTIYIVMKAKHIYDRNKRKAWELFYSKNKGWINRWYQEKGLKSRPPVYYDQKRQKWTKLNRKERRKLLN